MKKTTSFFALTMVATLLFGSMTVNAAEYSMSAKENAAYMTSTDKDGVPNWFNGAYYANNYEDLKNAFGDNEKALYHHSLEYGFKEGRLVSPVLDVAKYRAAYKDLDKAFGDNWSLYVRHYFEYGIAEGRKNFTDFDAQAYLNKYTDLRNAFGTDLNLATRHYIEFGISENRAYQLPQANVTVSNPGSDSDSGNGSDDDMPEEILNGDIRYDIGDGTYYIVTYENNELILEKLYDANDVLTYMCEYENGNVIKYSYYEDGVLTAWQDCEYNSNNQLIKTEDHDTNLDMFVRTLYFYDDEGNQKEMHEYHIYPDQEMYAGKTVYDYYPNGHTKYRTYYNENNVMVSRDEFHETMRYLSKRSYYHSDGITPKEITTYDESYNETSHKYYDENGVEISS